MRVQLQTFGWLLVAFGSFVKSEAADELQEANDTICTINVDGIESCYPRIFQATNEFQNILPGQHVPPELHIRIDMQTGQRQARLMPAANHGQPEEIEVVEANVAQNEQKVLAAAPQSAHNDRMQELVNLVLETGSRLVDRSADKQLEQSLEELKDIVYDPKQAERLMNTPGALSALLSIGSPAHRPVSWSLDARRLASIIVGTMVQNSPDLQSKAHRAGAVPALIRMLRDEVDAKTAGKHVFALSALTRGHALALEQFVQLDGLRIVSSINPLESTVFRGENESAKLDTRIVRFIEDVLNPEFNPRIPSTSASVISQFASVWCTTLASRLANSLEDVDTDAHSERPTHERRLTYLHSLELLRQAYSDTCTLTSDFKSWVRNELARVKHSNDDEYNQALANFYEQNK
ncbi:nucleotide exchange factor sil1 [Coemansia brasiliensis]|uniref:Nucleotide exchange factor sil1 n=1 Tax=Coemansia brasiliensis TaxID=2650707 RepID=A0A9W8I7R7_9FUNG|nr:nucleotide exchange factor sil1 [Coemansia brasiliensis]